MRLQEVGQSPTLTNFAPPAEAPLPTRIRLIRRSGAPPDCGAAAPSARPPAAAVSCQRPLVCPDNLPPPETSARMRPRPPTCENTGAPEEPKVTLQSIISTSLCSPIRLHSRWRDSASPGPCRKRSPRYRCHSPRPNAAQRHPPDSAQDRLCQADQRHVMADVLHIQAAARDHSRDALRSAAPGVRQSPPRRAGPARNLICSAGRRLPSSLPS